jgi:copper chaperone NosL
MNRVLTCSLLASLALLAGACSRPPDTGPPQLRYGEQECDACRMLVSDERFAAALVFDQQGEVTKLAFDDINCVFAYLSDHPRSGPYQVYTHDLNTHAWLDARTALFVHSEKLETPMASQIAAASSPEGLERLLNRYPGAQLTFEEVAKRFTRCAGHCSHQGVAAP